MKKYIFLPLAALALGFAACEDDDTLGIPVVNPEIPAVDPSIVSVAPYAGLETISLETYNDNQQNVPVATISTGDEWPEGYDFGAIAQLSADESFSNPFEFNAIVSGTTILLNPEEVQGFIYDYITKDPAQQTLWVRYGMQAVNGKEIIRLGDSNSFIGTQQINVIPFSPAAVIEPDYYLILSVDGETWASANAVKFTHSNKSQYDDPNFSLIYNISADTYADGAYWKIIPQSTFDTFDLENGLVIGATPEDAEKRSGNLDESSEQMPGYIDFTGNIEFSVNLDRVTASAGDENGDVMTFSFKQAIENFWLAGDNVNGLSWSFSDQPTMWTNNYVDYAGFANLGSEFKFSPQADWGGDFGSDGGLTFEPTDDGQLIGKGEATGGKNINVEEPGFYYISLNYSTKALEIVKITSFGIIGGFNGWGESVEMKASEDNMVYTITADLNAGDEWKFRANNQWTVSLGGALDNLSPFNGDNIKCTETGTYDITLDLSTIPWTATVVKK